MWLAVARTGERGPVTLGQSGREGPASGKERSATRSPDNLVACTMDGAFLPQNRRKLGNTMDTGF
jgi:hypothetical protein